MMGHRQVEQAALFYEFSLAALMKPADERVLQNWPVAKRVNSSRADGDDATLIEKLAGPMATTNK